MYTTMGAGGYQLRERASMLAASATSQEPLQAALHAGASPLDPFMVADADGADSAPPPDILRLLLRVLDSPSGDPTCVLVPRSQNVADLLCALYSIAYLPSEFTELARAYTARRLTPGETVRVLPNGHVYVYCGDAPGLAGMIRLQVPGKNDFRSIHPLEALQLEPTDRKRPKGLLNSPLGQLDADALDALCGIRTGGNRALLQNRLLLLTARRSFQELLGSVSFLRNDVAAMSISPLSEVLPWGRVKPDGHVVSDSGKQADGEPIIGVSNAVEHIAEACRNAEPGSRIVVIDGVRRALANLQAFEAARQTQNIVIIDDHRGLERVHDLEDLEIDVWCMSPEEAGARDEVSSGYCQSVSPIARAADVYARFQLEDAACDDDALAEIADLLTKAERALRSDDDDPPLQHLHPFYRLLLTACEHVSPPNSEELDDILSRLEATRVGMVRNAAWMPAEAADALQGACDAFAAYYAVDSRDVGAAKAGALALLIEASEADGVDLCVCTKYVSTKRACQEIVDRLDARTPVITLSELSPDAEYDALALVAWPGAPRMSRLARSYSAPSITVLGYGFERAWSDGFRRRRTDALRRYTPDKETRARLTGLPADTFRPVEQDAEAGRPSSGTAPPLHDPSSWRAVGSHYGEAGGSSAEMAGDDTVVARYVGFAGGKHAYLTDTHRVPVVIDLGETDAGAALPMRHAEDLQLGDIVLFRDGSERSVLRAVSRALVGDAYDTVLHHAQSWKEGLWALGGNPTTVREILSEAGLERTELTIRNWLHVDGNIGPQTKDDLARIARVTENLTLSRSLDSVWDAIAQVRTMHVRAGHTITQALMQLTMAQIEGLAGYGASIELYFGTVWPSEVEYIADRNSTVRPHAANRLLNDDHAY